MKNALITGVTGQDGSYLAELLLEKGYKVYGLNRRKAVATKTNIQHILDNDNFKIVEGDMLECNRISNIIKNTEPNEVYHLASQSFVKTSWDVPIYTADTNALGTLRLLEGLRELCPDARLYHASSSEIFGRIQEMPQNEMTYHYPRSPYGCSKSFAHNIVRNYRESYGMFACNGISFNHESERRGLEFVTRKITHTVAEIKQGITDKLVLGNLNAKRDWGYAPDYVRAMWMMLQQDKPVDYVVSTGQSHTVREFAELAFEEVGMHIDWNGSGINEVGTCDGRTLVEVSKEFYRPVDVEILMGDLSKIKEEIGWQPKVSFREMISLMIKSDMMRMK